MGSATHTDDQLRAAWRVVRGRAWPPTFEEAMADPLHASLVRAQASRTALLSTRRPAWAAQPARLLQSPARPAPVMPAVQAPRQAALFDRKRAASGEHEDD
jgi:hypothetical protein